MPNTIITPQIIAKEALMQLENNVVMGKLVHREYKNDFVKVGETVSIRKPVRFSVTDGATRVEQDVQEASTPFTIDKRKHVSWAFSTQDMTMKIEEYSERYIKPAMIQLADTVDNDLTALYKRVSMYSGTAGTTPNTFKAFGGAMTRLDNASVPMDSRNLVINPTAHLEAADILRQVYNPEIVKGSVRGMKVGSMAGAEIYMDQNVKRHTTGTGWGAPLINGAAQAVTYAAVNHSFGGTSQTLSVDTLTANGQVREGDRFTIAGVFSVNAVSKQDTGILQEFVVLADATATVGGAIAALQVSPAIITSGPYQTVTAAPADNAVMTVAASHTANLAFHKNAFGLVMCPLEIPQSCGFGARETHNSYSVRVVKDYDINSDKEIIRLDIFYGVKALYPELATILLG